MELHIDTCGATQTSARVMSGSLVDDVVSDEYDDYDYDAHVVSSLKRSCFMMITL